MMQPNAPGILPSQIIRKMIGGGLIRSASGKIPDERVQATSLDLTLSDDSPTETINPGASRLYHLDEVFRLPKGIHVAGDGRSRSAKSGLCASLLDEGGGPVQPGYRGRLMLRVESRCHRVRVGPGVSLAHVRFYNGCPEESRIDPSGLPEYQKGYDFRERRMVMHLNLNDGGCPGYMAIRTRNVLDTRKPGTNRWEDFYATVEGRKPFLAGPGGLLVLDTIEELKAADGKGPYYACTMPASLGPLRVNAASLVEFGSTGRHALEIYPPDTGTTILTHGQEICCIEFNSIAGNEPPDRVYGPHNGNTNLSRILLGPFFLTPGY